MQRRQVPLGPDYLVCPDHKKKMNLVCHTCPLWKHVKGKNPNTGEDVDEWDCAKALIPMLLIEVAMQARQAGAATESLRNEIVKRADARLRSDQQEMIRQ